MQLFESAFPSSTHTEGVPVCFDSPGNAGADVRNPRNTISKNPPKSIRFHKKLRHSITWSYISISHGNYWIL